MSMRAVAPTMLRDCRSPWEALSNAMQETIGDELAPAARHRATDGEHGARSA
ncbi:MAG: hypothetical protein ACFCUS_00255 [Rubrimonas sp.]|uniref:hypothetical protein n=1 Tax=Rubrimonas sp. TaxID=2036015 RepID=UPI002FDCD67B